MQRLRAEISSRWPVTFLSAGRATGFYESVGWAWWVGLSYTKNATDVVPDGEQGGSWFSASTLSLSRISL
jgi:hypothetical protein